LHEDGVKMSLIESICGVGQHS